MKRAPPVAKILLAVAAALLTLAAIAIAFPNWMRGPIEAAVQKKSGRAFVIGGDLHLGFWSMRAPFLRMHDVRFDNPAWAKSPHLVTAREAEFSLDLPALLAGRLVLPYVRLSGPDISLERDVDGQRSWVLKQQDDGGEPPQVRALSVDQGVLRYRDAIAVIDITARVSTGGSGEKPTIISFSGTYRKAPLRGEAQTAPVLNLHSTDQPFPMSVQLRKGDTLIEADGTFTDIVHFGAVDTWLKLQGPDWSQLDPLIPVPLPKSPPYSIEGRLKRSGAQTLYENFKGKVGSSDLAGTLSYDQTRERPLLKAKLESRVLDLKDLGPVIGKPKAQSEKPRAQAAGQSKPKAAKSDRKLPTEPLNVERMNRIDADVVLNAKQLRRPDALPLDNFATHLKLTNGVLALDPLRFSMAGGAIDSTLKLDARRKPIQGNATVRLKNARLSRLFPKVEQMKDSTGVVGGSVELAGSGNSVAELLATSSGQMGVAMTGGTMSNLLVELLGLDGGEALKFLAGGDRKTEVRCAVAAFAVKDGVATSQTMVLDTDDTNISGTGVVNLREETLDVRLHPEPKDKSILVVRAPVRLHGPFADIDVSVDKKKIAARIGASVLLGAINPLAALIPLIETGPGKDADCAKLLGSIDSVDKAKRAAHQPPPPTRLPPSTAEPTK